MHSRRPRSPQSTAQRFRGTQVPIGEKFLGFAEFSRGLRRLVSNFSRPVGPHDAKALESGGRGRVEEPIGNAAIHGEAPAIRLRSGILGAEGRHLGAFFMSVERCLIGMKAAKGTRTYVVTRCA
jgi:hypothetical protein